MVANDLDDERCRRASSPVLNNKREQPVSVKFQKLLASTAILAVAAFAAVGCGGDSDKESSGGGDLAKKQEMTIQIGDETDAGVFDPPKVAYLDSVNRLNALFVNLYRYSEDGSEMKPFAATELPEISEDGLTYTVKLREDAKWSDGKPLTADDLVFGVQHALDPASGAYFASFMLDIVGACEYNSGKDAKENCTADYRKELTDGKPESVGVTATDDHTVEFKLVRPVPWFDQLMTLQTFVPLRRDVIEKFGDKWTTPENIVTSGAFTLAEYKPKERIVVEKNPEFWDADDVELDKITFRMIGEPKTALREFERGRIDLAFMRTAIDSADIDRVKGEDYYVSRPSIETQYAYFNTTNPELSDPKVRQALAIGIDRPSIVENITKRGDKPMNTVAPDGIPGFDVFSQGAQEFIGAEEGPDVDKAKGLLEEAGWDEKETLDVYFSSDSGNAPQIAEQMQSDWAKIGVKVKLNPTPGDVLATVGLGYSPVGKKVDVVLQGWIQDYLDAQDWYQLFTCDNVAAGLNSSNYCSEDFDKIYEEALKTVDPDARFEIYKELEAKLTGPDGDMPAAPLYQPTNDTVAATYVLQGGKPFELTSTGLLYYENLAISADKK
ncbi:MAG: oligopeptide transporter, periplasmic oligopeptide-binding protein [Thermoleophilia bacterium]|nr:oligopeptide transporter, periplasmic oligopeptide-binding protein [Thermoleophilia bacterium]